MRERPAVLVTTIASPWGPIHAAATERGVAAIAMLAPREGFLIDLARSHDVSAGAIGSPSRARRHLDQLDADFERYFASGIASFTTSLDLIVGSAWDRLVLDGVRTIPSGAVATYGEVAARIGRFGAARAVGGAVGRNPIAIVIPCHRVIAAGGRLGGYGGDWYGSREERLALKRDLLRLEGVTLPDEIRTTVVPDAPARPVDRRRARDVAAASLAP